MNALDFLNDKEVYLSDGAWGTEFMKRGFKIGDSPELLNVDNPDMVKQVAKSYADAGADIVLTNSFGGNRITLAKHNLEDRVEELNRSAYENTKTSVGDNVIVVPSMGPTGKMVMMGEVSKEELKDAFLEQANVFKDCGATAVVIETMADVDEYSAATGAVKEAGLFVIGCMSFDSGSDYDRTMMGTTIEQMVKSAEDIGVDMVGANCGVGIENYLTIAEKIISLTKLPVWIKANAGLPEIENGKTVYKMQPEEFAGYAKKLANAGVKVVGGCCGTSPEFIAAVRQVL